jgi:transposase
MEDRSACVWLHADRWLSVDEIAADLGIKRDTVYKWIAEKKCRRTGWAVYGNSAKKKWMNG